MRLNNNSTYNSAEYKTYGINHISRRQVTFSASDISCKAVKEALNKFEKNQNAATKFFKYINKFEGDIFNILVANVGTAIVCPLVIAYNPISKEDKKTRVYSAWREPISAAIALATQLAFSLNAEKYIDKYKYESLNNKPILGEHLDFTVIKEMVTDLKPDKKIRILNSIYKDFETQQQKDKFVRGLKKFNKNFDFSQLGNLENLLENQNKFAKLTDEEISTINKLILKKMSKAEIDELILCKAEQVAEKVEEIILRENPGNLEDIKKLLNELHLKLFTDLIKHNKETKKVLLENIAKNQLVTKTAKNLSENFKENVKDGIRKIYCTRVKNLSQFKNISSIVLALVTVPFVTYFLNWVYPKFMDKFFPHLSKVQQNNIGGSKR